MTVLMMQVIGSDSLVMKSQAVHAEDWAACKFRVLWLFAALYGVYIIFEFVEISLLEISLILLREIESDFCRLSTSYLCRAGETAMS